MGLRRRLDDRWCTRRIHRGDPAKPRSDRCSRQPWWCAVIGTVLPVCRPWTRSVAMGADVCLEPIVDVRDRAGLGLLTLTSFASSAQLMQQQQDAE